MPRPKGEEGSFRFYEQGDGVVLSFLDGLHEFWFPLPLAQDMARRILAIRPAGDTASAALAVQKALTGGGN